MFFNVRLKGKGGKITSEYREKMIFVIRLAKLLPNQLKLSDCSNCYLLKKKSMHVKHLKNAVWTPRSSRSLKKLKKKNFPHIWIIQITPERVFTVRRKRYVDSAEMKVNILIQKAPLAILLLSIRGNFQFWISSRNYTWLRKTRLCRQRLIICLLKANNYTFVLHSTKFGVTETNANIPRKQRESTTGWDTWNCTCAHRFMSYFFPVSSQFMYSFLL